MTKGYNQLIGTDFHESFSLMSKLVTVRLFLAVAIKFNWLIHQCDINNAYLHDCLDEEVYMLPFDGYLKSSQGQVYKLNKSIYGLNHAGI